MALTELDWQCRTKLLIGEEAQAWLSNTHVLLAGVGGVGGYVAENLVRAGIGHLTLVDMDVVNASNRNRQLVALTSSVGMVKVEAMANRLRDINPDCKLTLLPSRICDDIDSLLHEHRPDMVVDAIDSVSCKANLLVSAYRLQVPIFSSMGAGRRQDVTAVKVMDVMDTAVCGLARQMRHRLRKAGVGRGITCVASSELPRQIGDGIYSAVGELQQANGTISYMPAIFGVMLAGVAVQHRLGLMPVKC